MRNKCKDWQCEMTPDTSIIEEVNEGERRFNFPKLWLSVIAKSLEEAEKKIKAMTESDYDNKSI